MATPPLQSEAQVEETPLQGRLLRGRSILSFLVAFAILLFFASRLQLDVGRMWGLMVSANLGLFLGGFVVYYLTFPLRGGRWWLLLENNGLSNRAGIRIPSALHLGVMVYMSWFANCVIPAKLGDAYRGYQLKQASGVSFSTAMGTVLAERFIDIVVLVGMLMAAALGLGGLGKGGGEITTEIFVGGMLLLVLGVVGLGAMWMLRDRLTNLLPTRFQSKYANFQESTFGSFKQLPVIFAISVAIWLGEVARLFLVVNALGISVSVPFAIFLALANSLLTVVPLTPGGLGLAEAGTTGLLMLGGVDKDVAATAALLDRIISYWSIILFGFIVLLVRRRI